MGDSTATKNQKPKNQKSKIKNQKSKITKSKSEIAAVNLTLISESTHSSTFFDVRSTEIFSSPFQWAAKCVFIHCSRKDCFRSFIEFFMLCQALPMIGNGNLRPTLHGANLISVKYPQVNIPLILRSFALWWDFKTNTIGTCRLNISVERRQSMTWQGSLIITLLFKIPCFLRYVLILVKVQNDARNSPISFSFASG